MGCSVNLLNFGGAFNPLVSHCKAQYAHTFRDHNCHVSHRKKIKLSEIYLEVSDYILLDETAEPGNLVSSCFPVFSFSFL